MDPQGLAFVLNDDSFKLAVELHDRHDYFKSNKLLKRVLQSVQNSPFLLATALTLQGQNYLFLGQHEDAYPILVRAASIETGLGDTYANVGNMRVVLGTCECLVLQGKYDEASFILSKMESSNLDFTAARLRILGDVAYQRNGYKEAAHLYKLSLQVQKEDVSIVTRPYASVGLARVYLKQQRYGDAVQAARFAQHASKKQCPGSVVEFDALMVAVQTMQALRSWHAVRSLLLGVSKRVYIYQCVHTLAQELMRCDEALHDFLRPDVLALASEYRMCIVCFKVDKRDVILRCQCCLRRYYCSDACQDRDWPEHQKYCQRACASCERYVDRVLLCSGCKQVAYCGRECQERDWIYHQAECRTRRNTDNALQQLKDHLHELAASTVVKKL